MKTLINSIVIALFIILASCGEDGPGLTPEEVEQERITNLLVTTSGNPWQSSAVSVDGVDVSTEFNNLTVSFTETSFTTQNGGDLWPAGGTWNFQSGSTAEIVRNDGLVMTISQINESSLVFTFTWDDTIFRSGKLGALQGNYIFNFSR